VNSISTHKEHKKWEIIFQIILHLIVFLFLNYDRYDPTIDGFKVTAFINYSMAALVVNYVLLPRFFYTKKYLPFFLYSIILLAGVMFIEEMVLEKIYYPDSRGMLFLGVLPTLIGILPPILILIGFKFAWDVVGKQREIDELKTVVQESELQFLKTQINPHFLFNNLNNLYSYAIEQSPKTPEIILELSGFLRYMLYECKEQYVPLVKEVEQLKNFINLNEMQIEERGQVNFQTQNIHGNYQVAPLILIVFIENAFKHSTTSQSENIFIDINLALSDYGDLKFVCKNSYLAQANTDQLSKGIGMENVQKRLSILYPNSHQLNIQKEENQYNVELTIHLSK